MPEPQAEALADEQVLLIDDRLAPKEDIARLKAATQGNVARLEASTKREIARLEASTKDGIARLEDSTKRDLRDAELRLEGKIDASKAEMLKSIVGTIGLQTVVILGALFGLVRLFVR